MPLSEYPHSDGQRTPDVREALKRGFSEFQTNDWRGIKAPVLTGLSCQGRKAMHQSANFAVRRRHGLAMYPAIPAKGEHGIVL